MRTMFAPTTGKMYCEYQLTSAQMQASDQELPRCSSES